MSNQPLPVQYSLLDENALADWARSRYPLSAHLRCRFYRSSMSDVYLLNDIDAAYFLKIYLIHRHTQEEIEAEIRFLNDLLECNLSVAAPVANRDGIYLNEIDAPEGKRYAVLFDAVNGEVPQETNLNHSRKFGELAGRLHNCADKLGKRYSCRQLDDDYFTTQPLNAIKPFLDNRKRDLKYLIDLSKDLMNAVHSLVPTSTPQYGLCHGDLHTGNARFNEDEKLTLFDFDSFGSGWRSLDIGVYHVSYDWMNLSEKVQSQKDRFWGAFVEGYNTERSLSDNELAAAQLSTPLRHLELMGLTIRYWSPQIGISWINDDYFDEHIDWFKQWVRTYKM